MPTVSLPYAYRTATARKGKEGKGTDQGEDLLRNQPSSSSVARDRDDDEGASR